METILNWNKNSRLWKISSMEFFWAGDYIMADLAGARESIIGKHTEKTDKELLKLRQDSPGFLTVLKKRFLTFGEFVTLTGGNKNVDKGLSEFAMQYYGLLKKSSMKSLLNTNTDHEKNYLELLQRCLAHASGFFFSPKPLPVPLSALNRHLLITGRTGSGKTQFMQSLFYQLQQSTHVRQQASLVLLDPHGDISAQLLSLRLNLKKSERLWYIDPQLDGASTPCLNPFWEKVNDPILVDLLSQQWAKAFAELMPETGMSLQMETLLKPCLSVMFQRGRCGLMDLQEFMDDTVNGKWVDLGMQSSNPVFRSFFSQAFPNKKYAVTKLAIYTRLQHLMNNYCFYQMMNGQSSIDLKKGMQQGKVILFNLSKGKLGEDTSRALGRFISATLLSIALQRAFEGEDNRKPCYLFVDEFHNLASSSMETVFSEARKYSLHLIVGTQSIGQLPSSLKDMVLNNTAVKLVGINGLPALKSQAPDIGVSYSDLQNLPPYHFYLKYDHHPAIKIKSPDFLLKYPNLYFALPKEVKSIKEFCLLKSGIYRSNEIASPEETYKSVVNDSNPVKNQPGDFTPKFEL
ncbi:MAG: type IV secretion system DNA-binding domain-containing protein [Flavobacterium sp.]|nr:type IV secretion system DNA-binding domain-containing protein [Flavobacterium sp.]